MFSRFISYRSVNVQCSRLFCETSDEPKIKDFKTTILYLEQLEKFSATITHTIKNSLKFKFMHYDLKV